MRTKADRVRFEFARVEQHVAVAHPDPDGDRQHQATTRGVPVAAPWVALLLGVDVRRVIRWRRTGTCGYWEADLIATRLGMHPTRLWPEWAHVEVVEPVEQLALVAS